MPSSCWFWFDFYRQHCAKRNLPVFNLLRGRFWGFSPRRGDTCTDWGEIWYGGGDRRFTPPCQILPQSVQRLGHRSPETEIFTEIWWKCGIETPRTGYPLRDFHKICRVCTPFQDTLGVKIWLDLVKGLWSYGGFKFRGLVTPKFSAPPSGETMRQTPKV